MTLHFRTPADLACVQAMHEMSVELIAEQVFEMDRSPQPEGGEGLPEYLTEQLDAVGQAAVDEAVRDQCHSIKVLHRVFAEAVLLDAMSRAESLLAERDAENAQLRARVAELEAKLATPSYYWGDDENGAVESPEEWAEMQYGITGEAFESMTLRCAIELPEREYDSIEFDAEGHCISICYVGEVKNQPSGGKEKAQ